MRGDVTGSRIFKPAGVAAGAVMTQDVLVKDL